MAIDLYYTHASPPCRNVMLTAKAIGIDLNLIPLDILKGEHKTPEYIELNFQHSIPFLVDGDLKLCESRAIMGYLVNQYAEDDTLYPKDPKKRAIVDQRLYFDMGTLYQRFADLYFPVMFAGKPYDPEKAKSLDEAYVFFDKYLGMSPWAAGDELTIADISFVTNISTLEAIGYDLNQYPNLINWYAKVKEALPDYQKTNQDGVDEFVELFKRLTSSE